MMGLPLDGPIGHETLTIIGAANGVVISTPPGYRDSMIDPERIVAFTSAVAFAEWAKRHFDALMRARAAIGSSSCGSVGTGSGSVGGRGV